MKDCLLCVENLSKRYSESSVAVRDVSFDVFPNEIFVLVGPSGCGKTTTLRVIAGYERADSGCVDLDNKCIENPGLHVPPDERQFGFVFQDFALFPHMTVLENVCFGLRKEPRRRRKALALKVLNMVAMADMAGRSPHDLSGGQQQRVALARSIAPAPKLILLDEPFSNLDAGMRQTMRYDVRRLLRRHRMSALLVTHDQEEALSFADRIGVMHDGRIEQTGQPQEVYNHPQTAFVARFLGRTNLLPAQATGDQAHCPLGDVQLYKPATGAVTISIRPEHLRFEHLYPGQPAGQIIRKEFKGHDLTYTVHYGEHTLIVQTDYACIFQVGQSVRVTPIEPAVVVRD